MQILFTFYFIVWKRDGPIRSLSGDKVKVQACIITLKKMKAKNCLLKHLSPLVSIKSYFRSLKISC
jgi:intracellular sulfur oxidation DsrE/DsrF family protein